MSEQYFEMLWDCPQCSARGLLGKAQRHCPLCGAAQDPAKRYFPAAGEEVVAQGHQYVGVDWSCAFCTSPNAAAAAFCVNCGGTKDGTRSVATVQDGASVQSATLAAMPPPKGKKSGGLPWFKLLFVLLALLASGLGYLFFSTHPERVQVVEKTWNREVDIEQFSAASASSWCDALPVDAYQVSRSREQRGSRQVPDGQQCREQRVDMGDGTFSKRQECTPRYRQEPVYDDKCSYRVNRWQVLRAERAQGDELVQPYWPGAPPGSGVSVAVGRGEFLGALRLGSRRESYRLSMRSAAGKVWSCELPSTAWARLEKNQALDLQVRATGSAVCDNLAAGAH